MNQLKTDLTAYFKEYVLTSDTTINSSKTYYTRSGTAPNYIYTKVANPIIENIGFYYEIDEDFSNILVKGAYDEIPVISYPMVTILEILNEDNTQYDDVNGENISDLGYQFDAISGNTKNYLATEAASKISRKIDNFIKTYLNGRYSALRRTSRSAILPLPNDSTKIKSSTTYLCSLDIKNNIIYKLS